MKITFENDHEADKFFQRVIRGLYGVGGAVAHHLDMAKLVNDHADNLSVSFFQHYRPRMEAGADAPPAPAPQPFEVVVYVQKVYRGTVEFCGKLYRVPDLKAGTWVKVKRAQLPEGEAGPDAVDVMGMDGQLLLGLVGGGIAS